jgi:hypothetical protein
MTVEANIHKNQVINHLVTTRKDLKAFIFVWTFDNAVIRIIGGEKIPKHATAAHTIPYILYPMKLDEIRKEPGVI